jgi:hypothetical protein
MTSIFELKVESPAEGGLVTTLLIDGKPFGEDCVDLGQLRKSAIVSGAYDIQTCGCGEPACAGFWEPIFVQHESDLIRWEFDGHYHPIPSKDDDGDDAKVIVIRYEFDRMQYIEEVRSKFAWLRDHPRRNSLGPYGFNSSILDEEFPDPMVPQLPFLAGSTIIVGYTKEFHQPWIWVEGCPDIYPRQLLPTGVMWAMFGEWSLMWGSQHFDFGQCIYMKDSSAFALSKDVSVCRCNQAVGQLVLELQQYWGASAKVVWDWVDEHSGSALSRHAASSPSERPG